MEMKIEEQVKILESNIRECESELNKLKKMVEEKEKEKEDEIEVGDRVEVVKIKGSFIIGNIFEIFIGEQGIVKEVVKEKDRNDKIIIEFDNYLLNDVNNGNTCWNPIELKLINKK